MNKTISKPKSTIPKKHPLEQSLFYKLHKISQIEALVSFNFADIETITNQSNYRPKKIAGRDTQLPKGKLREIHRLIGNLLSRIKVPKYVFSQKGVSFIDNAIEHRGKHPVGKTDLSRFFPSISEEKIIQMFRDVFICPKDVATVLGKICSYNGHLPTGSYISGYIAFFCAKPMFDEIEKICTARNIKMTVFVDDITFSGTAVNQVFLQTIKRVIKRHGFICKRKKTKLYQASDTKKITGVILVGTSVRVPNSLHHKAYSARKLLKHSPNKKLERSYIGQKQHHFQILKHN